MLDETELRSLVGHDVVAVAVEPNGLGLLGVGAHPVERDLLEWHELERDFVECDLVERERVERRHGEQRLGQHRRREH